MLKDTTDDVVSKQDVDNASADISGNDCNGCNGVRAVSACDFMVILVFIFLAMITIIKGWDLPFADDQRVYLWEVSLARAVKYDIPVTYGTVWFFWMLGMFALLRYITNRT